MEFSRVKPWKIAENRTLKRGSSPPRAEMPIFKLLFLNNLRSKTIGQIQNLVPHRLMSRLKSKTTPGDTLRTARSSGRFSCVFSACCEVMPAFTASMTRAQGFGRKLTSACDTPTPDFLALSYCGAPHGRQNRTPDFLTLSEIFP